ncbi:acyl carrier protein [Streptomyces sp. NBRC 110611]|uniref:acyl carrier protein n=1 Tax=Streptomyces sp. NBRC 110611 TaxID=1621259 RepID=UPI000834AF5D|nr:acyl carrier protein [Streptomyces sp. NBRC 110611]GAU65801.1 acyl carrier protein [Streptomyces sp. NBRC 110611]
MSEMTLDDLRRLLIECAGETDDDSLSGDILDKEFDSLGYDSLALMETATRITSEYGVQIPDERIAELKTPRAVLELVNGASNPSS